MMRLGRPRIGLCLHFVCQKSNANTVLVQRKRRWGTTQSHLRHRTSRKVCVGGWRIGSHVHSVCHDSRAAAASGTRQAMVSTTGRELFAAGRCQWRRHVGHDARIHSLGEVISLDLKGHASCTRYCGLFRSSPTLPKVDADTPRERRGSWHRRSVLHDLRP